jgi:hypothetical protein
VSTSEPRALRRLSATAESSLMMQNRASIGDLMIFTGFGLILITREAL